MHRGVEIRTDRTGGTMNYAWRVASPCRFFAFATFAVAGMSKKRSLTSLISEEPSSSQQDLNRNSQIANVHPCLHNETTKTATNYALSLQESCNSHDNIDNSVISELILHCNNTTRFVFFVIIFMINILLIFIKLIIFYTIDYNSSVICNNIFCNLY